MKRLSQFLYAVTGRELQRLLHPRAPALHSPLLYTDIPNTVLVAGNSSELTAFRAGLASHTVQTELHGLVCISGNHQQT